MVEFRTPCWFLVLEALERSRCRGGQHHHYNLIFDIGTVQKGGGGSVSFAFFSIHVVRLSSLRKDHHPTVNSLQRLEVSQHLLLQFQSNS